MGVGETNTRRRETVEVGCRNFAARVVTPHVTDTEIVREDDHDIRHRSDNRLTATDDQYRKSESDHRAVPFSVYFPLAADFLAGAGPAFGFTMVTVHCPAFKSPMASWESWVV